jgi:hypothetical protein
MNGFRECVAAALVVAWLWPFHASAAVYHCTSPGKPDSYQGTPCEAGTAQAAIPTQAPSGDPLVGEFVGKVVDPKPKPGKGEETMRFRVTREGHQYSVSMLTGSEGWAAYQGELGPCPSEILRGFVGERSAELDPVGVCGKGFFLIHSRRGKEIPKMSTTGYALILAAWGGGAILQLEKVK